MPDMDFDVVLEVDEDGWYIAHVPLLPGCHTQGKTKKQVLERVKEAIEAWLLVHGPIHSQAGGVHRVHVEG